jgi:predicted transcriptional regulator
MGKRKIYNTTLDSELTKGVRILAAQLGKRQDDLLEEAIQDLLKKYIQDLEAPLLGLSEG